MPVKKGDKVMVHYTGTLDDGTVFDSSEGKEPLEFEAGSGLVIPGFDNAVMGMKPGEEKAVKILPKDAYGDSNPALVREFPRSSLPPDTDLKEGQLLLVSLPDGRKMPVQVKKFDKDTITLDINHPLAGQNLNFRIKLVEVSDKE